MISDKEKTMKKAVVLPVCLLLLGFVFSNLPALHAADKTLTLPKGTTIEKLGPGHFRFVLPGGRRAEIKNYDPKAGILGDCGVYDKGKLVMKGTRGALVGVIDPDPPHIIRAGKGKAYALARGQLVDLQTLAKVPKSSYVMIDDEVTWLPATVLIESKVKGKTELSPQPDPPGARTVKLPKGTTAVRTGKREFKLSLPNGQAVKFGSYDPKTGILGDCGFYNKGKLVVKGSRGSLVGVIDPEPPHIVRAGKGKTYAVVGSELVNLQNMTRIPKSSYVMIDDEVTWLPAKIKFN
jgi:hypothetical protein